MIFFSQNTDLLASKCI